MNKVLWWPVGYPPRWQCFCNQITYRYLYAPGIKVRSQNDIGFCACETVSKFGHNFLTPWHRDSYFTLYAL